MKASDVRTDRAQCSTLPEWQVLSILDQHTEMLQEPVQLNASPATCTGTSFLHNCNCKVCRGEHEREEQRAMLEFNKLASQPEASCMQIERIKVSAARRSVMPGNHYRKQWACAAKPSYRGFTQAPEHVPEGPGLVAKHVSHVTSRKACSKQKKPYAWIIRPSTC